MELLSTAEGFTVGGALQLGASCLLNAGIDSPGREAQLLMMFMLSCRLEDLIREPERTLTERERLIWAKSLQLRSERRPLAYITGKAWFYGRQFKVNRAVLIPRPETEMLVEFVRDKLPSFAARATVADIGAGSGCIAVTVALEFPDVQVAAVDISELALHVLRKNSAMHGVSGRVIAMKGDLVEPLSLQSINIIVSNPPYIPLRDVSGLMPEVRNYEPPVALYEGAGEEGTLIHRRLLIEARSRLTPDGWLAMEVAQGQADQVCSFASQCGYKSIDQQPDFAGIPRIIIAQQNN